MLAHTEFLCLYFETPGRGICIIAIWPHCPAHTKTDARGVYLLCHNLKHWASDQTVVFDELGVKFTFFKKNFSHIQ